MKTRAKTFDCVEEKKRVQKLLLEEYAARKGDFSSCAGSIAGPIITMRAGL